jgi:hypothetical protein
MAMSKDMPKTQGAIKDLSKAKGTVTAREADQVKGGKAAKEKDKGER